MSTDQFHVRAGKDLAVSEAVSYLPRLRYKDSGLRQRRDWERTWELQRAEDRARRSPQGEGGKAERVGPIPVPPKYTSADFQKGTWWSLRGKVDVPKERFVLYPGAEREADPSPVLGWACWSCAPGSSSGTTTRTPTRTRTSPPPTPGSWTRSCARSG